MKKLFVAATRRNDGKTTLSLGLIKAMKKRGMRPGFIKPIGQRYLIEDGHKVDEDSILIARRFGIKSNLRDMSPIAIERGFTEKYIESGTRTKLVSDIEHAFEEVSRDSDIVVIEGTGHAGVGSCFDMSNAFVSKLMGSKVILVSSGGIGRAIDEIILNKALFDREGVEVAGVVVNKVVQAKYEKVARVVRKGLERNGLHVLGVLPYRKMLASPRIGEIAEGLGFEYICGKDARDNAVDKIIVGAMEPRVAWHRIEDDSLVITPGDREDMLLMAISSHLLMTNRKAPIAGIILTGGVGPQESVIRLLVKSGIPVLISKDDTYVTTSNVHDLTVKVKPSDERKVEMAISLVEQYIDMDYLIDNIA